MKKSLVALAFCLTAHISFAQFYIQPNIEYTFSSHPEIIKTLWYENYEERTLTSRFNYGQGLQVGLNVGYMIKDHLFLELIVKHTAASNSSAPFIEPMFLSVNNYPNNGTYGSVDYETSMQQLSALIGYQLTFNKLGVHFKIGPNLMWYSVSETRNTILWSLAHPEKEPVEEHFNNKRSANLQFGVQSNIGLCYSIRENLQITMDFVTVNNNFKYPEHDEKEYLPEFYKNNITIRNNKENSAPPNVSHIGIEMGVRYIFRKKGDDNG